MVTGLFSHVSHVALCVDGASVLAIVSWSRLFRVLYVASSLKEESQMLSVRVPPTRFEGIAFGIACP